MWARVCVSLCVCARLSGGKKTNKVKETLMTIPAVRGVLVNLYKLTFEGEANPRGRLLQAGASVNT